MRAMVLVALVACSHRVNLRAPGPDAPGSERVAAFMQLRPVQSGTLSQNGVAISKSLILADQTEVVLPEDLEPLVGTHSETMDYARASERARTREDIAFWGGAALFLGGVIASGWARSGEPWFGSPWYGVGAAVVGGIMMWPVRSYYARQDLRMRTKAFGTYTRDLGERLNVCADGMQVVACDEPRPTPAPPPKAPATSVPDRTALRMRR